MGMPVAEEDAMPEAEKRGALWTTTVARSGEVTSIRVKGPGLP